MEINLNKLEDREHLLALKRIEPRPTWWIFSGYADGFEKKIEKLLRKVPFLGVFESQRKVLELMEKNLVILNLFLEQRFKGYKYLSTGARKKMHRNAWYIARDFLDYSKRAVVSDEALKKNLLGKGLSLPPLPEDLERLRWLALIMAYLSPYPHQSSNGKAGHPPRFEYLEGASFGKLLINPQSGKAMIGDCNQIVTFYTFLYSLKYSLKDLQIKLPEKHVCLHYKGIDIEATSGQFAKYDQYEYILPIVELISTNLLDVSDFRDKQIQIAPRDFLKAAHLAESLSSQRSLVTGNLKAAYHNVALEAMESSDFETAIFFLEKSGLETQEDQEFLKSIAHNATLHFSKLKNFSKARFYLDKYNLSDLKKYVDEQEGFYNFEGGNLTKARDLFGRAGNLEMIKACFGKEYNQIQKKVAGIKDLATMRSHRSDYEKMLDLAGKMADSELQENLRNLLKQL